MPNNFEDNYDMLQDHDDFMLPSLSQINQWLADNIQQRGSPISIIQTLEQSNLPPSTTQDQQLGKEDTDLAQDGKHSQQVDDKKIKINVEYKFFFIIPEDKPTNPRQKKRKASNNDKKCKPLPSTPGLVHFNWDANKQKIVKSFKEQHWPQPEEEDKEPEPSGGAVLLATIMKNIQELRAAHKPCKELSGSAEADNPEVTITKPPPSDLFAFTTKEKRLKMAKSQNSDNGPITPRLTLKQSTLSVSTAANPSPTATISPMAFGWSPQVAAMMGWTTGPWAWQGGPQANIAGLMNLTEIGTPPNAVRSPNIAQLAASTQEQQTVPLSTVPSNDNLKLNDFFQLAHVEPNQNLLDGLEELGIAHYSHFHSFSAKDLKDAGVKMGHARILMDNLKKYKQYIKSHHNGNHA
ncbi:hypothetical protein PtB15_8B803 [Puccinia triticina]|nr:hypothetical protein PtB15_8B803 [Puccinia triticina]